MSTIFLDTSIQVQRTLLDERESAIIEAVLSHSDNQVITSDYVWMEYQRTIMADYAHI